jgi:hypothetical protein
MGPNRGAVRGLLWVNRVTLAISRPLPVYPDQQTFLVFVGMSQTYQQETFASICISDPAARALPDEAAQFHIAEGRSKTRILRQ